jgi:protein-S-isoprenylcysteine O-methyltransferase Ste14
MTTSRISDQTSPDSIKVGDWLFRHRTALPLPIAAAILGLRTGEAPPSILLLVVGVGITMIGELIRLWGVHHIGAISRTRSDRLGPLIDTGPFALIRNPLYVGNILLWVGFAVTARLLWLAPVVVLLLGAEYHAIVKWEESLLASRLGDAYRSYTDRVPRWLPTYNSGARKERREQDFSSSASSAVHSFSWKATLFSERGTLMAMASGYLLLWIKARF